MFRLTVNNSTWNEGQVPYVVQVPAYSNGGLFCIIISCMYVPMYVHIIIVQCGDHCNELQIVDSGLIWTTTPGYSFIQRLEV